MGKPEYRIYPSLLDKFQDLIDYQAIADKDWNIVSAYAAREGRYKGKAEGDYIVEPWEMHDRLEADLLDCVNRKPHAPNGAATRGTCLNEVVDSLVSPFYTSTKDVTVIDTGAAYDSAHDGFAFRFAKPLVHALAERLAGSVCQARVSAVIDTPSGTALLYGYPDYWLGSEVIDLKTTASYQFGDYGRKWQRHVYPWCGIESGAATGVDDFAYLVVKLPRYRDASGVLLDGQIYAETYNYDHAETTAALRERVAQFIEWLEANRNKITDKKIFEDD